MCKNVSVGDVWRKSCPDVEFLLDEMFFLKNGMSSLLQVELEFWSSVDFQVDVVGLFGNLLNKVRKNCQTMLPSGSDW